MFTPLDKLFYIIYNNYYKHGKNGADNSPAGPVYALFFVAFAALGFCLLIACYLVNDPDYMIKKKPLNGKFWILIGSFIVNYFCFYRHKRYRQIYDRFKKDFTLDDTRYKIIAFTIVYVCICSPFIFGFVYNKFHLGRWY